MVLVNFTRKMTPCTWATSKMGKHKGWEHLFFQTAPTSKARFSRIKLSVMMENTIRGNLTTREDSREMYFTEWGKKKVQGMLSEVSIQTE